jgi:hypothetical protein
MLMVPFTQGTRAWMALQLMFAQQSKARVKHTLAHDLEGYYYVILSLAFMFDEPYVLNRLPNINMGIAGEYFLRRWLDNSATVEIWQEAADKKLYFCTDEGFSQIQHRLGGHWKCLPILEMLRKMRALLFGPPKQITHDAMLRIIDTGLSEIRNDISLSHLCTPVDMTLEWAKATGGLDYAKHEPNLPAMRMNLMYHNRRQVTDLNLFARMPQPLEQTRKHSQTSMSQSQKSAGKTEELFTIYTAKPYEGGPGDGDDLC